MQSAYRGRHRSVQICTGSLVGAPRHESNRLARRAFGLWQCFGLAHAGFIVLGAEFQAEKALSDVHVADGQAGRQGLGLSPKTSTSHRRAMQRYVSVPEKTLKHCDGGQYITSRFSTHAALRWPVDGQT